MTRNEEKELINKPFRTREEKKDQRRKEGNGDLQ